MKMLTIVFKAEPDLKAYLEKLAKEKGVGLSKVVRAAVKKGSGYKEKPIV